MEPNDSPEIPDRVETSDITGLPSGEVGTGILTRFKFGTGILTKFKFRL